MLGNASASHSRAGLVHSLYERDLSINTTTSFLGGTGTLGTGVTLGH